MARWIVAMVVVAMALPLAACKRERGEAQTYDPKIDPPVSVVQVTIDPNIKEPQNQFNTVGTPAAPAASSAGPAPSAPTVRPPAAAQPAADDAAPAGLIDTSPPDENAAPADEEAPADDDDAEPTDE